MMKYLAMNDSHDWVPMGPTECNTGQRYTCRDCGANCEEFDEGNLGTCVLNDLRAVLDCPYQDAHQNDAIGG